LVVSTRWAVSAAIFFCWVKIALGALVVLLGIWEVITLNLLGGLLTIVVGSILIVGLAFWTLSVLRAIRQDSTVAEG
jgi:hypothetical protein